MFLTNIEKSAGEMNSLSIYCPNFRIRLLMIMVYIKKIRIPRMFKSTTYLEALKYLSSSRKK